MPVLVCAVAGPLRLAVPGRARAAGALAPPPRVTAPRSRGDPAAAVTEVASGSAGWPPASGPSTPSSRPARDRVLTQQGYESA